MIMSFAVPDRGPSHNKRHCASVSTGAYSFCNDICEAVS
jgi:hypothetical protein